MHKESKKLMLDFELLYLTYNAPPTPYLPISVRNYEMEFLVCIIKYYYVDNRLQFVPEINVTEVRI